MLNFSESKSFYMYKSIKLFPGILGKENNYNVMLLRVSWYNVHDILPIKVR